jgi:glycine cleavage system H protein
MAATIDPTCHYTKSHEWVRVDGDEAYTGLTDYAQEQLSDIVYVELPEEGDTFDRGEVYATVESVKAASDCYLPISGEVLEVNDELTNTPELVNSDPYGEAWLVKVAVTDASELEELMDADAYAKFVAEEEAKGEH